MSSHPGVRRIQNRAQSLKAQQSQDNTWRECELEIAQHCVCQSNEGNVTRKVTISPARVDWWFRKGTGL